MANVIIRSYNTFFDHQTNVQFNPALDKANGLYIGVAQIPDSLVPHFKSNPAYEIVSDLQLAEITGIRPAVDESKLMADVAVLSSDLAGSNAPALAS
jgi:hypothetical protein